MELYLEPIYRDRNCKGQFNKGHRLRFGGRPCSEGTKKKLSEIMKKRIADGSTKMPHFQKAVIVIKDGRIVGHYPSATEMARRLGITKSIIIRVCLGIRESYRGCNLFYEKMPHFQKAVIVIKDGRIVGHYPSATEMARRLGITKSIIIRVCLGIRKSYRGCNLFYECDSDKWMKLIKE